MPCSFPKVRLEIALPRARGRPPLQNRMFPCVIRNRCEPRLRFDLASQFAARATNPRPPGVPHPQLHTGPQRRLAPPVIELKDPYWRRLLVVAWGGALVAAAVALGAFPMSEVSHGPSSGGGGGTYSL